MRYIAAALLLSAFPAKNLSASTPHDYSCSLTSRAADGSFRSKLLSEYWGLYYAQKKEGQVDYPEGTVRVTCFRRPFVLVTEDVETLRQGIAIRLIGTPPGGPDVTFTVQNRKLRYEVTSGSLTTEQKRGIDNAIKRIEAAL